MRNIQRVLSGLGLLGAIAVVGCSAGDQGVVGEPIGTGDARIILAARGDASANMHITLVNDVTHETAFEKVVEVDANGSVVLQVALEEAPYTVHLDAFVDAEQKQLITSGEAHLDLKANAATEIILAADTDAGASGGVSVSINDLPEIKGVVVHHSESGVTITVDAEASADLSFYWSGFGVDGAVKGGSSFSIAANDSLETEGTATTHLVVQNRAGATLSLDISLVTFVEGKACIFCDGGTVSDESVIVDVGESADVAACLEERAECDLACQAAIELDPLNITAAASCKVDCGLALAACEASIK